MCNENETDFKLLAVASFYHKTCPGGCPEAARRLLQCLSKAALRLYKGSPKVTQTLPKTLNMCFHVILK